MSSSGTSRSNPRALPDATGKLPDDDSNKNELNETATDSGFISSGNLIVSGDADASSSSETSSRPVSTSFSSSRPLGEEMRIHSGFYSGELSLSEKLAKVNLNDLNDPKVQQQQQQQQREQQLLQPQQPLAEPTREAGAEALWKICYQQDEDGDTHLHIAIANRLLEEVVLTLIRLAPHPRLLDTPNDRAQTPLHLATETGQYQIVRWLMIAGARPSPRDSWGDTPLHIAARNGDANCIRMITEPVTAKQREELRLKYPHGHYERPVLDQCNYVGQTCVHVAAISRHLNVLRQLVACGADVNARERLGGLSALHYAVENGDESMIRYLLTECATADPEVRSYGGRNALQFRSFLPDSIRQFLQDKGLESPYPSDSDDDEDDDDDNNEEEMPFENQVHRLRRPNLVNASA